MKNKDEVIFKKIVGYIEEVFSYMPDDMAASAFQADRMRVNAAAFILGQIGELAGQISEDTRKNNPAFPWVEIKGLRNRIVHDYESVDLDIIWEIITSDLPMLKRQILGLLEYE